MRRVLAVGLVLGAVLSGAGCSASNPPPADAVGTTTLPTDAPTSTTTTAAAATTTDPLPAPIDDVARIACDTAPVLTRVFAGTDIPMAWECNRAGEVARLRIFMSTEQETAAARLATEDGFHMAELPIMCGELWSVAVSSNTDRDALIAELNDAGFPAQVCSDPPALSA